MDINALILIYTAKAVNIIESIGIIKMEDKVKLCNICGREFDFFDEQQNIKIEYYMKYGSSFDGTKVSCRMCIECFDKFVNEYLVPKSIINPIMSEE